MKVMDLDNNALEEVCHDLAMHLNKRNYDIIIAIASGGIFIAKLICKNIQYGDYVEVKCSRTTTKTKKNELLIRFVKRLPLFILNILRNIEHFLQVNNKENISRNVSMSSDDKQKIFSSNLARVLIVDDAVDSGKSIEQVVNYIKHINPSINIETLSIVVTSLKHASFIPDYYAHSNILIRFPWAIDAKK